MKERPLRLPTKWDKLNWSQNYHVKNINKEIPIIILRLRNYGNANAPEITTKPNKSLAVYQHTNYVSSAGNDISKFLFHHLPDLWMFGYHALRIRASDSFVGSSYFANFPLKFLIIFQSITQTEALYLKILCKNLCYALHLIAEQCCVVLPGMVLILPYLDHKLS